MHILFIYAYLSYFPILNKICFSLSLSINSSKIVPSSTNLMAGFGFVSADGSSTDTSMLSCSQVFEDLLMSLSYFLSVYYAELSDTLLGTMRCKG